jgi:hypothetical protein
MYHNFDLDKFVFLTQRRAGFKLSVGIQKVSCVKKVNACLSGSM